MLERAPQREQNYQNRLSGIYERFIKFPPTDIEVDGEGQLIATNFSYHLPDSKDYVSQRDNRISGRNFLDGRITIFFARGVNAGLLHLNKNAETGQVELTSATVYRREGGQSMTIALSKNGKSYKPDLAAVEHLMASTEKKLVDDPSFFSNQLTQEQRDKVMAKIRGIVNGRVSRTNKNRFTEKQKQTLQRRQEGKRIAVVAIVKNR